MQSRNRPDLFVGKPRRDSEPKNPVNDRGEPKSRNPGKGWGILGGIIVGAMLGAAVGGILLSGGLAGAAIGAAVGGLGVWWLMRR